MISRASTRKSASRSAIPAAITPVKLRNSPAVVVGDWSHTADNGGLRLPEDWPWREEFMALMAKLRAVAVRLTI